MTEADSDLRMLLREAQAGPHIASDDHTVLVRVPHQNNFEMPLRVEVWTEPPPRDFGQWEEIFECALEVDGGTWPLARAHRHPGEDLHLAVAQPKRVPGHS
ncbi:hypothetical protein ONA70_19735 [Micromonospora yasonensis]|uniref:hypothetical protein n=1 Tax=Micromonospora yasonensis TaxID=1128667 RepID=UPI00222E7226|nr:hypothetical protein [Micromonospora yasonensis]MCW3842334.1 hypothetical protein [Micromonospora yasonensis]